MRKYYDTETENVYTETELKEEYTTLKTDVCFADSYPHFELWLREISGKNGTLVQVYN